MYLDGLYLAPCFLSSFEIIALNKRLYIRSKKYKSKNI